MVLTAAEQFFVLAIVLIAGFVLGFASRPSGARLKARLRKQAEGFAAYHADAKDRLRAARERASALEAEAAALRADHVEAERTIAALRGVPPVEQVSDELMPSDDGAEEAALHAQATPDAEPTDDPAPEPDSATDVPRADFPMTPTPSNAAPAPIGPARHPMPSGGWLGQGDRDDLTRIRGIDDALAGWLFALGIAHFADLEALSPQDEMALEQRLGLPAGYVTRERWRAQAALLRVGKHEEHAERFGAQDA